MFLIIGLGNIGKDYELTRHNIGFMVVDLLAKKWGVRLKTMKHSAIFGKGLATYGGFEEEVVLAKPLTYMNSSGRAVKPLADAFSVMPNHIIVIHDDVDLALGRMKVKVRGSSAGHKGVSSIMELVSDDFVRIRIGIGRPQEKKDVPDYVLSPFASQEFPIVKEMISLACDSVETIIFKGVEEASRNFNR
ncbi:MAG: aminoacyl-tRNA hydrolase [Caldisericaceae bacterium]